MGDERDDGLIQWQGGGVHRQRGAPVIDQPRRLQELEQGLEGGRGGGG